ncbi:MAG: hypothetical protein LBQ12_13130, partial [Deltaproteobacteria bacterium]|nr:hypothetical protein [Deltaproteobacteria bacterium]
MGPARTVRGTAWALALGEALASAAAFALPPAGPGPSGPGASGPDAGSRVMGTGTPASARTPGP